MDKSSFLLYTEYGEEVAMLSHKEAGLLLKAIFSHAAGEEEPVLTGGAKILYSILRRRMDKDRERYEETCQKRGEYGRLGGRPKKKGEAQAQAPEESIEEQDRAAIDAQSVVEEKKQGQGEKQRSSKKKPGEKPKAFLKKQNNPELDLDLDLELDLERERERPPKAPQGVFERYAGENLALLGLLEDFAQMRKASKAPMTDRAKALLVGELDRLSKGYRAKERYQITLLEEAILHNWKSVYPLQGFEDDVPSFDPWALKEDMGRPDVDWDTCTWEDCVG